MEGYKIFSSQTSIEVPKYKWKKSKKRNILIDNRVMVNIMVNIMENRARNI